MANHIEVKTAAELSRKLNSFRKKYAGREDGKRSPPTWPRLAVYLGTNWQSLNGVEKAVPPGVAEDERDRMAALLAAARAEFEADEVDRLYEKDLARGATFSLKNIFGWRERQEVEASVEAEIDVALSGGIEQYSM